jgi:hypothetical protein
MHREQAAAVFRNAFRSLHLAYKLNLAKSCEEVKRSCHGCHSEFELVAGLWLLEIVKMLKRTRISGCWNLLK